MGILVTTTTLIINHSMPIPKEITDKLYLQERLVTQDFSNLNKCEHTTVNVKDSKIIVKFQGINANLKVEYDKEYNILSKKFTSERICDNIILSVLVVIIFGLAFPWLIFIISMVVLSTILDQLRSKKRKHV